MIEIKRPTPTLRDRPFVFGYLSHNLLAPLLDDELDMIIDQINIYIKRDRASLQKHTALIDHIKRLRLQ